MHYIKMNSATPAVKLYPRLAVSSVPRKSKRSSRRIDVPTVPSTTVGQREAARQHVRARLLDMIIENERVRRDEQRPNAS